jgi:hypothetical protein
MHVLSRRPPASLPPGALRFHATKSVLTAKADQNAMPSSCQLSNIIYHVGSSLTIVPLAESANSGTQMRCSFCWLAATCMQLRYSPNEESKVLAVRPAQHSQRGTKCAPLYFAEGVAQ